MSSVFIARQPIVTDSKKLYAYELLFRDFSDTASIGSSLEFNDFYATSRVAVNVLNQFGIERLVGNREIFINADEKFIEPISKIPICGNGTQSVRSQGERRRA